MRWDDIYLSACASWLPPVMPAEVAVARGLVGPVAVRRMQVTGVTVAEDPPPEMAARAARLALDRAGLGPDEIGLILHSSSYYQGHDMWAPASYVQRVAVGNRCPAVEIRQTSNGGMASLELAAAHLRATGGRAALLTTGDRFCPPGLDRWRSDPGTVLADGASAVVVTRGEGFARLVSLVTVAEPDLEQMHRGEDPWGAVPFAVRRPVDVEETTQAFLRTPLGKRTVVLMALRHTECLTAALDEAGMKIGDVDRFVLPHFGRRRMDVNFFRRFGIDPDRTTWSWSRGIGHLGAGDQFAGLNRLVEHGQVRAGDRVLMLGVGGGFAWSAALLEIERVPDWAADVRAGVELSTIADPGPPSRLAQYDDCPSGTGARRESDGK
ncbi:ketoacyl-ACP synthase III family protein [Micromonospora sp. NPDC002296]|uniref:ketoacyl-ACP synthase III family protein n=1 Tax=Micromonospora sp. NPDC002296 TaxID=3154271 RepID=UPI00332CC92D